MSTTDVNVEPIVYAALVKPNSSQQDTDYIKCIGEECAETIAAIIERHIPGTFSVSLTTNIESQVVIKLFLTEILRNKPSSIYCKEGFELFINNAGSLIFKTFNHPTYFNHEADGYYDNIDEHVAMVDAETILVRQKEMYDEIKKTLMTFINKWNAYYNLRNLNTHL